MHSPDLVMETKNRSVFFKCNDTSGVTMTLEVQGWQVTDSKEAEQLEANLRTPPPPLVPHLEARRG